MKIFHVTLIFFFMSLYAGFDAGTRVRTPNGSIPIEQLYASDLVITHKQIQPVTHTHAYKVGYTIRIVLSDDASIVMSATQRVYLPLLHEWKSAQQVRVGDGLGIDEQNYFVVQSIEHRYQTITLHHLIVQTDHTFIVEPGLVVHNPAPAIGIGLAWAFGQGVIEFVGASFMVGILGACLGFELTKDIYHEHNKNKNNRYKKEKVWKVGDYQISGLGGNPEDPNKDNKKHPHGIFEGAMYHKDKQSGRKSPGPLDGQSALDNSISYSDTSSNRVGISKGQFVMLNRTRPRVYHGYTCDWWGLEPDVRAELVRQGMATVRGKIVCMS